ncbi:hypothetical protein M427DRAFT_135702 [Gonapodya prolifera JEL478]|uniref:Nudix hydrolase domain-containing protein n=1 Tax=Gonapodya prolifera (strain JEL478) TaxID=1344416 RepID=A0A139ACM9_GONPJ|nr:hypothetical protein M427DRAFT_135702 [Gonapodya prolifera JEL478]|eukprot:KXS14576.1 hypothetical protein M427DRAFT_135702 [Gonapodya prolifera JEL478]
MPHPSTQGGKIQARDPSKPPATPIPASTLLVVAPLSSSEPGYGQKGGFRVLMIKRSSHGFFGSLTVFPGGKIDPVDSSDVFASLKRHPRSTKSGAEFHSWEAAVGAVRETFEETGVLILGKSVRSLDSEAIEQWRKKASKSPKEFVKMCESLDVTPNIERVAPWSRWITPPMAPKRFDTRFFLTTLSKPIVASTTVSADGHESTALAWLKPLEALELAKKKEIHLIIPQVKTLEQLSEHTFNELEEFVIGTREQSSVSLTPTIPGVPPVNKL